MTRYLLLAVVLITAVCGSFYYNQEKESELSDLAKANIKALAGWPEYSGCIQGDGYCAVYFGGKLLWESYIHYPVVEL